MKNIHRLSGIIVSIFIVAHLFNHSMAWFGIEKHQAVLEALRTIYRIPIIEFLLIGLFLFQGFSGIRLFFSLRKKLQKTTPEVLKMYSGLVLGLFLVQHISATLWQRFSFGLDTNFYFAANVVVQKPLLYYFAPYYFLGIMSFATHLASIHQEKATALWGAKTARLHFILILGLFLFLSFVILFTFMGGRYEIIIPQEYQVL